MNVAKNIRENSILVDGKHPIIAKNRENNTAYTVLDFKPIKESFVIKQIIKFSSKKATGHDGISAKFLKFAKPVAL